MRLGLFIAGHFFIFKSALLKVLTMAAMSPSRVAEGEFLTEPYKGSDGASHRD
jgi:hypothetical protein